MTQINKQIDTYFINKIDINKNKSNLFTLHQLRLVLAAIVYYHAMCPFYNQLINSLTWRKSGALAKTTLSLATSGENKKGIIKQADKEKKPQP